MQQEVNNEIDDMTAKTYKKQLCSARTNRGVRGARFRCRSSRVAVERISHDLDTRAVVQDFITLAECRPILLEKLKYLVVLIAQHVRKDAMVVTICFLRKRETKQRKVTGSPHPADRGGPRTIWRKRGKKQTVLLLSAAPACSITW